MGYVETREFRGAFSRQPMTAYRVFIQAGSCEQRNMLKVLR